MTETDTKPTLTGLLAEVKKPQSCKTCGHELSNIIPTRVLISYAGSGDEGYIDGVSLRDATGETIEPAQEVRSGFESWAYDVLENSHGGWEINEGSFGEFEIDVATAKVKHVHNNRYESYDTEETKF